MFHVVPSPRRFFSRDMFRQLETPIDDIIVHELVRFPLLNNNDGGDETYLLSSCGLRQPGLPRYVVEKLDRFR